MKKLIVVALLVLLIVACKEAPQTPEKATTTNPVPVVQPVAQPAPPAPATALGEVVFSKEIAFTAFPAVEKINLGRGRYVLDFTTDSVIQVVLYDDFHYKEWQRTEMHTLSKMSTVKGSTCCAKSGSHMFDINDGEEGYYYLVFDPSKLSVHPKDAQIKITRR